jgi:hypothetical protein
MVVRALSVGSNVPASARFKVWQPSGCTPIKREIMLPRPRRVQPRQIDASRPSPPSGM